MRYLFAHGAGTSKDSEFMLTMTKFLEDEGIEVIRFNFPYMEESIKSGRSRPPNRESILVEAWQDVISKYGRQPFFIGGKSMGGRIASLVAPQSTANGLICLGYPFHSVGKMMEPRRLTPVLGLKLPTLIMQGTRDLMGSFDELQNLQWPASLQLRWLADGDHSFKPRKSSGHTQQDLLRSAALEIVSFIRSHC